MNESMKLNGAPGEEKHLKAPGGDEHLKASDEDECLKTPGEDKPLKAPVKDETPKVPGEAESLKASSEDEPLKAPGKDVSSEKRKPRLNRRGFHLINNPIADLSIEKPKPTTEVKSKTDAKKSSTDGPQKKVISLVSVKKSFIEINPAKEKKIITLKGTSSSTDMKRKAETSETSSEGPPQKKHKPITWP